MTNAFLQLNPVGLAAAAVASLLCIADVAGAQTSARPVQGTSTACEQWAVFATKGSGPGRIEVCSGLMKEVPRLREQVELLNQRAANDADAKRDLQRFAESLNQMARQIKAQDAKGMVETLVAKLEQSRKASDGEVMDELARLRLGMSNLQRALQSVGTNEQARRKAEAAMAGEVGTSIAQLDFEGAKGMLTRLVSIETKLDGLIEPAEARVLLASERRRAAQQMQRFSQAGAEQRCKVVYDELVPVLQASEQAEQDGKFNTARNLLLMVYSRALQATSELQSLDRIKSSQAAKRMQDEDNLARLLVDSERRLANLDRSVASSQQDLIDSRRMQREQQERSEQSFRTELLPDEKLVVEIKRWIAAGQTRLREAESLPQATADDKARRQVAMDQAKTGISESGRQLAEVTARAVKERANWDGVIREERAQYAKQDAERTAQLKAMEAARDHLAAAIAKARTDGRNDPDAAAQDLRFAESESSDLSNGQQPRPRPRRVRSESFVMPNAMCV